MEQSIIKNICLRWYIYKSVIGGLGAGKKSKFKKKQIKNISFLNAGRHTINYIRQAI